MTLEDSIQGFRLVLTDATRSGNVTATCARFGVSRTWFYRLRARLERYARRTAGRPAGVDTIGIHALRHAYATELRRSGADLADVQELLGHRDIRTTRRYAPVVTGKLREAVEPAGARRGKDRDVVDWQASIWP